MGDNRFRVGIVGGGISGLSAALRLQELSRERELPIDLQLFEQSSRLGGLIRTEREGDLLLEAGPDQFVTHKPAAVELCRRLGLERDLFRLDGGRPSMQVLQGREPVRVPDGVTILGPTRMRPLLGSKLFSWRGKARIAAEPLKASRAEREGDETVGSFVRRRFGTELLDRVVEPIIGGIFTADVDQLSVEMTLPAYPRLERKHGSVLRGLREARRERRGRPARPALLSLKGGLERLIETLAAALPEGSILRGTTVERVSHDGNRFTLSVAGRPQIHADALILACPSYAAAKLIRPWEDDLAEALEVLHHADCATVNLLYPREAIGRALEGFGFFVPRAERLPILACSYVNAKFPDRVPGGTILLRAFLGGALQPGVLGQGDDEMVESAHRCLAQLLRIRGEPRSARLFRYPRSMPQFPVGYRSRLGSIHARAERYPGLFFCGGIDGAIGLPDCIASGDRVAGEAIELGRARTKRAALVS